MGAFNRLLFDGVDCRLQIGDGQREEVRQMAHDARMQAIAAIDVLTDLLNISRGGESVLSHDMLVSHAGVALLDLQDLVDVLGKVEEAAVNGKAIVNERRSG